MYQRIAPLVLFLFYCPPAKTPVKLPKICRSQKIGFVGLRLLGDCGVGKVFVPLKFDALETLFLWLNGQNRFHVFFSSVKLRAILETCVIFSVPLI